MEENKKAIIGKLLEAVQLTRAGSDIKAMEYLEESEAVLITYEGGTKSVNVACDSGVAMICDVMRVI